MSESWAVTVERNGENVVTLASNCHGGRDLSDEDERIVRLAADHLSAFIGQAAQPTPAPKPCPRGHHHFSQGWQMGVSRIGQRCDCGQMEISRQGNEGAIEETRPVPSPAAAQEN